MDIHWIKLFHPNIFATFIDFKLHWMILIYIEWFSFRSINYINLLCNFWMIKAYLRYIQGLGSSLRVPYGGTPTVPLRTWPTTCPGKPSGAGPDHQNKTQPMAWVKYWGIWFWRGRARSTNAPTDARVAGPVGAWMFESGRHPDFARLAFLLSCLGL